jgi:hypothetical protein
MAWSWWAARRHPLSITVALHIHLNLRLHSDNPYPIRDFYTPVLHYFLPPHCQELEQFNRTDRLGLAVQPCSPTAPTGNFLDEALLRTPSRTPWSVVLLPALYQLSDIRVGPPYGGPTGQIFRTTAKPHAIVSTRKLNALQHRVRAKSSARDLPR